MRLPGRAGLRGRRGVRDDRPALAPGGRARRGGMGGLQQLRHGDALHRRGDGPPVPPGPEPSRQRRPRKGGAHSRAARRRPADGVAQGPRDGLAVRRRRDRRPRACREDRVLRPARAEGDGQRHDPDRGAVLRGRPAGAGGRPGRRHGRGDRRRGRAPGRAGAQPHPVLRGPPRRPRPVGRAPPRGLQGVRLRPGPPEGVPRVRRERRGLRPLPAEVRPRSGRPEAGYLEAVGGASRLEGLRAEEGFGYRPSLKRRGL